VQATEALRITAPELVKLGVMDTIVPEPLGGAHSDPVAAFPAIKDAILSTFREYEPMSERQIQLDRWGEGSSKRFGRGVSSSGGSGVWGWPHSLVVAAFCGGGSALW
jgi:hypothetical protein